MPNYNYFRDYDPNVGRYVESDPIGLAGGSYSTYAYANENPVSLSDPMGLWVKLCSRLLGNKNSGPTSRLNPLRHDYLDVSGQFIGFYPGSNEVWGQGVVAGAGEQDGGRCSAVCNDNKFDAYVLKAKDEIGAPTYCPIASIAFGAPGIAAMSQGAINCQTWAWAVLERAKQDCLAHEDCPTCFK